MHLINKTNEIAFFKISDAGVCNLNVLGINKG